MKDIRSWLLKHSRPNQEVLLTRLALNLVDKKRSRMLLNVTCSNNIEQQHHSPWVSSLHSQKMTWCHCRMIASVIVMRWAVICFGRAHSSTIRCLLASGLVSCYESMSYYYYSTEMKRRTKWPMHKENVYMYETQPEGDRQTYWRNHIPTTDGPTLGLPRKPSFPRVR